MATIALPHRLAHDWFQLRDGVVRAPLLVKGRLVAPAQIDRAAIERAFTGDASYARIGDVQVLRHAELDRETMQPTGAWIYRVLPAIDPHELVERDIDALERELYAMPYERVIEWLRAVRGALRREAKLLVEVGAIERATSEHPDAFVDAALAAFPMLFDESHALAAIDAELARHGASGPQLLDGWIELPGAVHPGPSHVVGGRFISPRFAAQLRGRAAKIRALPTRQLHITAGNSPLIPLFSLLRAVWTKSPAAIKLPSGAVLPGALVAYAAATAAPDHPLTRHLSMVYWPGGDDLVERQLLAPGNFDRIVVWGDPESVASVRQRAGLTKTLSFNPRYGASLIGREGFADLDEVATRAVFDTMIENQKACIASLVHYVEGDVADAELYAAAVLRALARWDELAPHPIADRHRGQLKRLQRGQIMDAQAAYHAPHGDFASGVVVAPHDFAIKDHPMCRLVVVRPVASLDACLGFLHAGVATVGVYPEARRHALRDRIAARGVSHVAPLGEAGSAAVGAPHDGMLVLSELVDWKSA